ncbi:MAG: hypothetical protein H6581_31450 [Bacteroidia bacterium]|nr:hypothetical protein [Bacteroidia bacterium]
MEVLRTVVNELRKYNEKDQISSYDKDVLHRIEDIQNLDPETKEKLFFLIDNVIQNYKTRQAFS